MNIPRVGFVDQRHDLVDITSDLSADAHKREARFRVRIEQGFFRKLKNFNLF